MTVTQDKRKEDLDAQISELQKQLQPIGNYIFGFFGEPKTIPKHNHTVTCENCGKTIRESEECKKYGCRVRANGSCSRSCI